MITSVRIMGDAIDPCFVVTRAVTVSHGRSAVDDGPTASTASLTLLASEAGGMPPWSVGDSLSVYSTWGPLFAGTITDRRIPEHVSVPGLGRCASIELTAMGAVAMLGRRPVGATSWPQEESRARADRILGESFVPYTVDVINSPDVQVIARAAEKTTALDAVEALAKDTGAAVVDLPEERVLYQPLAARERPFFYYRWQDFPATDMWSGFSPTATWADFAVRSPASEVPLLLPSCAVGYEPEWMSTAAAIVNSVAIGYGEPQAEVTQVDQGSVDRYGTRHSGGATQLARLADAQRSASRILSTRAWERWSLGSVDVYVHKLTATEQAAVAALRCGDWVEIRDLPQPAPAIAWAAICEGWTYRETHSGNGSVLAAWTLALSDPVASLAVPIWSDYLPAFQWDQHSPLAEWADLTYLAAIGA